MAIGTDPEGQASWVPVVVTTLQDCRGGVTEGIRLGLADSRDWNTLYTSFFTWLIYRVTERNANTLFKLKIDFYFCVGNMKNWSVPETLFSLLFHPRNIMRTIVSLLMFYNWCADMCECVMQLRTACAASVLFMDLSPVGHIRKMGKGRKTSYSFVQLVFIVLRNIFKVFCAFQHKSEKKIYMGIWQRGGCRSQ